MALAEEEWFVWVLLEKEGGAGFDGGLADGAGVYNYIRSHVRRSQAVRQLASDPNHDSSNSPGSESPNGHSSLEQDATFTVFGFFFFFIFRITVTEAEDGCPAVPNIRGISILTG